MCLAYPAIDRIKTEAKARKVKVTIILDFVHVLEYLWNSAWCFYPERDPAAEQWVHHHATQILEGHAKKVAGAIRRKATKARLDPAQRKNADDAANYLTSKARYLDCPTALRQGWPIATGIIEGACRHIVKDRMDITGARWGLTGAEAVLKLRALRANGEFDDYWRYHLDQERHLVTGGMLLLVYALVKASTIGWGNARTIGEIASALALLVGFVINELRHRNPLAPMSIFRINGLGFSNITQLTAIAGFLAMFFFLTLYMQNVLHYSPIQTGLSYLPPCFAIGISAGISSQLLSRVGTRPVIVTGALIAAAGMYWLSRIAIHGAYLDDLLPGMIVLALGFGPVFVGVTTAANAGVPADKSGLAASLLNASQQLGGALGLAVFTALATSRTHHLLATHTPPATALTGGLQRALLAGSIFILAAAIIALRATNTRGETDTDTTAQPVASTVSRNHRRDGLLAAAMGNRDEVI